MKSNLEKTARLERSACQYRNIEEHSWATMSMREDSQNSSLIPSECSWILETKNFYNPKKECSLHYIDENNVIIPKNIFPDLRKSWIIRILGDYRNYFLEKLKLFYQKLQRLLSDMSVIPWKIPEPREIKKILEKLKKSVVSFWVWLR